MATAKHPAGALRIEGSMKVVGRGVTAAMGVALASVAVLLFGSQAAEASISQCGTATDCIWEATNNGGDFLQGSGSTGDFRTLTRPGGNWDNVVSSMANHRTDGFYFNLWKDYGYTGFEFCAGAGKNYTNLGSYHWDNIASSNDISGRSCV